LSGCTLVYSQEPVGSAPLAVSAEQIAGVWVAPDHSGELRCCVFVELTENERTEAEGGEPDQDGSAGRFRMISVQKDGSKLAALQLEGRFMQHRDVTFASIRPSPDENAPSALEGWMPSAHLFAVVQFQSRDEVRLLLPNEDAFAESVKKGLLPVVEGCGPETICLGHLDPSHLDYLTAPDCLSSHFTHKVVFRRFPFAPM
jgi:hypothetical protein